MSAVRGNAAPVVSVVMALTLALSPVATAAPARASLMDIENDVMCVVCNEPLSVAQSPQAYREKNLIRQLIAQGETKAQIERTLVSIYTVAVLGKPPAHGFSLTVYILPPAIVLAGAVVLVITLPRWRRRVRAAAWRKRDDEPATSPAEQQRLDEELSRFAG